MKKNKGITLLELLIAISLLTLILFAGSGIYLSGWQMFRDAQFIAQAQRKAMEAMMHMVNNLRGAASECNVTSSGVRVDFMQYGTPPTITSRYDFQSANQRIVYIPNITTPDSFNIIGTHINNCTFTECHTDTHGTIIEINLTAFDNNNQNPYTLISRVTARYTAVEPVFIP